MPPEAGAAPPRRSPVRAAGARCRPRSAARGAAPAALRPSRARRAQLPAAAQGAARPRRCPQPPERRAGRARPGAMRCATAAARSSCGRTRPAHRQSGRAVRAAGRLDEAIERHRQALALAPITAMRSRAWRARLGRGGQLEAALASPSASARRRPRSRRPCAHGRAAGAAAPPRRGDPGADPRRRARARAPRLGRNLARSPSAP